MKTFDFVTEWYCYNISHILWGLTRENNILLKQWKKSWLQHFT